MWRFALVCVAACAPSWSKPSYFPTALGEARHAAALDHRCSEQDIRFVRDETEWLHMLPDDLKAAYEPGGVVGTFTDAPRWEFVFDVCGEHHTYVRAVTDSPLRDPAFVDLEAWNDL